MIGNVLKFVNRYMLVQCTVLLVIAPNAFPEKAPYESYLEQGKQLVRQGKLDAAILMFKKSVANNPDFAQ